MSGGDLRFHISRKTFTEEAVRFWVAELACALRYIHSQGIVHRDLKPDNVLLDSDGHVHLADFVGRPPIIWGEEPADQTQNVASEFRPEKPLHSKSGTLAYLAPEVYAGTGYLSEVDWWSLGVTFYECIYNKVGGPPRSDHNPMLMYRRDHSPHTAMKSSRKRSSEPSPHTPSPSHQSRNPARTR